MKRWILSHGGNKENDIAFYVSEVRALLIQETYDEYLKLKNLKMCDEKWCEAFKIYFNDFIEPDIENLAKFALIKFDAYNPYTGITTNISESMLDYILNLIFKILLFKV